MPKLPGRREKMVTIPASDYVRMLDASEKWGLLTMVATNSRRWRGAYRPGSDEDRLCSGIADHIDPVVQAIRETVDEGETGIHPARRAWDLALIIYRRHRP